VWLCESPQLALSSTTFTDKDTSARNVALNNYQMAFKELDNNHQIYLKERIRNAYKTYFMLQNFFLEIKIYLKN
jgi:hypothetical protein